jgi:hypothetical protein
MGAYVDYTTEALVSTLFNAGNFTDDLHRYLGLDPAVPALHQPVDVEDLLHSAIHIVETDQWRLILPKTITLSLPYKALCASDNKVFLPYGKVSSLTTFAYEDSDDASQTLSSANYTLFSNPPAFIWAENWFDVLTLSSTNPLPITLTYTTGYTSFDEIPRSTLQAIKIMCYHHFVNRGETDVGLPMAYKHHMMHDIANNRRSQEFV